MERLFEHTLNTRPILENSLRFVRSDVPARVSEAEKDALIERGITTIVDLRTAAERAERPCPLADDARFTYLCMPVTVGNAVPATVDDVSRLYIAMVDDALHRTIDTIWTAKTNVLYFCAAGKDRTGVVSAILLHKSGMSREYIVADFMKTRANLKAYLEEYAREHPGIRVDVILPQERYMEEFLAWLETQGI